VNKAANQTVTNDASRYYGAIADHYHLFYRDWDATMQREGANLRRTFRDQQVRRVLDASCGTGTQSIAMAKLNLAVTAADLSREMLAQAQQNAARYGVADKLAFVQSHFLELPQKVSGPFDAVITTGNSLPHLISDADLRAAINTFYQLLRPGGLVVIGIRDYDFMLDDRPRFVPRQFHESTDQDHILFDVWDWDDGPPTTVRFNTFIVTGKGDEYRVTKQSVVYRALRRAELEAMLKAAGFSDIKIEPQQWEIIATAHRPAEPTLSPDALEEARQVFQYHPQWLESGFLEADFVRHQLREFRESADHDPSHYRQRAFEHVLETATDLDDGTLDRFVGLCQVEPNPRVSGAALLLLLSKPELTDQQFDRVAAHMRMTYKQGYPRVLERIDEFAQRRLWPADPPSPGGVARILATGDPRLQRKILYYTPQLTDEQLHLYADQGADDSVREMARRRLIRRHGTQGERRERRVARDTRDAGESAPGTQDTGNLS
jgi:ubiquinone/menaquinone biosynthesis C-methylase UbiE